jgi:hypothetical protein
LIRAAEGASSHASSEDLLSCLVSVAYKQSKTVQNLSAKKGLTVSIVL